MTAEVVADPATEEGEGLLDVAREYLERAVAGERDVATAQANACIAIGLALVDIAESLDIWLGRRMTGEPSNR